MFLCKIKNNIVFCLVLFFISLFNYKSFSQVSSGLLNVHSTVEDLINDKELKVGSVVKVLGYYEINDGGAAEYIIKNKSFNDVSLENDYYIELSNGLIAYLLEPFLVNYKVFGAKGDGVNNDAIQISKAHRYANARNLPIENYRGEFWLKKAERIIIQTDVKWGNTIFHIDEKHNNQTNHRFEVISKGQPQDIILSEEEKREFLSLLNSGKTIIPILEPYKNHLVIIADANDRVGARYGYKGQSWGKEDLFYVEESGRIIGDFTWSFNDYTKLRAHPVDKNYLHIEGGVFYLSGDNPSSKRGYYRNGIHVRRSKTVISNQWVGLEPGKEDNTTSSPRSGFYTFTNVYDVTLENVRLIPYTWRGEKGRRVHSGTYGISMGRVFKSHFNNVTAEGGNYHWGVFGTNLNKDFKIENCHLNRVDVHFHCWNLSILNSHIGENGISVTGGGDLIIDNSTCSGQNFVNFRSDYGSKWDGNIRITNSTLKVTTKSDNISVLSFSPRDFDYKYPIQFGKNIQIGNFKIDFRGVDKTDATCWIARMPRFSKMRHGDRIYFPNLIKIENVEVFGREKGIRLFSIAEQNGYKINRKGGYTNRVLNSNAMLIFDNIQLEDLSEIDGEYHLTMQAMNEETNDYSLYPTITFLNCHNIAIKNDGTIANFFFEKSTVSNITGNKNSSLKGRYVFTNCEFKPKVRDNEKDVYSLFSTSGTFFSNCIIHPPVYEGKDRIDLFNRIGFVKINQQVDFNHSNTLLNESIIEFYKDKIEPQFLLRLKGAPVLELDY